VSGEPKCHYCGKPASEDAECRALARDEPDYYTGGPADVAREDGTYNRASNQYACTRCYIGIGMPSSPTGWKVPT
jgi:hypothetical protein